MRTVYLGTSDFAATVLRALAESPHRPALVVTAPDRKRGRGRRMQSPPAAEAARELEIELLQASSVNDPEAVEHEHAVEVVDLVLDDARLAALGVHRERPPVLVTRGAGVGARAIVTRWQGRR